ncbi:thiamine phosphate synthase [Tamlana crocina]|uniref:Thiamine phosphate synthase n=1 Tax=Tamlana crocina TaxID=393006 RepID=A0ABX1D6P2_9FLAO|nr:thiamine phosphate synthase [Tamlana crocina]NJX13974.1 thiamine phosphate synthase [Tamlana crocina]
MVVLIAPEQDIKNEIFILNQLFEVGLEYFHLRKPRKDYHFYRNYLNQIDKKYHSKIVVHQHHELINDYNLKGIHFQEAQRRELSLDTLQTIRNEQNISMSSSFHSTEELIACEFHFDYHLLSPVFSSISKQGYKGRGFEVNSVKKTVIGMGGVTTKNLSEFTKLGYQGVGVLGGIWQSETPVQDFKTMKRHFE